MRNMKQIEFLPVERKEGRVLLPIKYGSQEVRFAYPPVEGTRQEDFRAIGNEMELRPAYGLELALFARGVYQGLEQEWKDIRQNFFIKKYTQASYRLLLIPAGHIPSDSSLSGVLIERDVKGIGLSEVIQVPHLANGWRETEGVYRPTSSNVEVVFVSRKAYAEKLFEQDGIVHAHLTPEGAEIFARTAVDADKKPINWISRRMIELNRLEQRISVLGDYGGEGWLGLDGHDFEDCESNKLSTFKVLTSVKSVTNRK